MAVNPTTNPLLPSFRQEQPRNTPSSVESLGGTFSRMLSEVNQLQQQADAKQVEFATSENKDLHGTMIAMQKADVSLRLLMQVRSKLTAAYQEISRMQI